MSNNIDINKFLQKRRKQVIDNDKVKEVYVDNELVEEIIENILIRIYQYNDGSWTEQEVKDYISRRENSLNESELNALRGRLTEIQEHKSVKKTWGDYLTSIGESITNTNRNYTSWYFCDNEKSANDLAKLVREGIKRGTASLHYLYELENEELPMEGNYSIITDWNGIAQCIIRTKKVTVLPFQDINDEFAKIEGEGDKSLKYWQKVHKEFFTRAIKEHGIEFSQNMLVVFEEFEVVYK